MTIEASSVQEPGNFHKQWYYVILLWLNGVLYSKERYKMETYIYKSCKCIFTLFKKKQNWKYIHTYGLVFIYKKVQE
jgi:hypothetical protein